MEDLLLLQYPAMTNRIKKARDLGFSDDEIGRELGSRVERARAAGFSELEINRGLGVSEASRSLLQEARRNNALESISDAYEMTIPRARKAVEKRIPPALMADEELMRRIEAEDQQVNVGPMHERPSVETLRTHSAFWRKINDPAIGVTNRAVGGLVTGSMAATGGFSRSIEWLTGWEAARSFADKLDWAASSLSGEILEGEDPNLWDAFWQGSGSLAFYLLPAMAIAKGAMGLAGGAYALGLSEKAAMGLAKWLGASTQQVIEGFSEAGPVYKRVLDETGDEGAASLAAAKTFWTNLPLGILTNRLGFFGDSEIARKALGKVLPDRAVNLIADAVGRGIPEAAQEVGQGLISRRYGSRTNWADLDLRDALVQEGLPGFLVAAITGSTFEAGRSLSAPAEVKEASRIRYRSQAAKVYNRVKEQLVATGMDEQQAGANAVLWSARAYTVGVMTGTDPEAWYEKQNLKVQKGVAPEVAPGEVYYQYAGKNAKVMPDGLDLAEEMRSQGKTNEEIRQETGWYFGMDGEARFEINDADARLNGIIVGDHKLGAILDFPALFKAYPDLADANVYLDPSLPDGTGEYYPSTDSIHIAPDSAGDAHQMGILLHEVQHAIQARENFADGGNLNVALAAVWKPTRWGNYIIAEDALKAVRQALANDQNRAVLYDKDGNEVVVEGRNELARMEGQLVANLNKNAVYDTYRRIAGEVEAWDVTNRHGLSEEERQGTPPDLRRDAIIVRNGKIIKFGASQAMPPLTVDENGDIEPNRQVAKAFWQSARQTSQGEPVDKLMKILDKADWYIFTAANPPGTDFTEEENAARNAQLAQQIEAIVGKAEKNARLAKAWELVKETDEEARYRNDLGYTQIVLVDPKLVREAWEAQHGESLVHAPERLKRLRGYKAFTGYPKVSASFGNPKGIEISDGRHRIVEAERRGLLIPVAMDPDYPIPQKFIKGTKKPRTRGKITVYEARGVFGGKPENSFMVTGLTASEAIELARKWEQAAITTPTGIYWVRDVFDKNGVLENYDGEFAPFTSGNPVVGTDLSDNYTEIDVDGTPVRFSYPPDFENTFWMPRGGIKPGIPAKVTAYLTPAERAKVRERTAKTVLKWLRQLPNPDEMASAAWAGRAKRGWYERSARAISEAFGQDAPRFAALLAALSPQCSVEDNLTNTLKTWTNWIEAGRPMDPDAITDIMGRSVQGTKGNQSILPAWTNNAIRALTDAPEEMILSGPKVDSFRLNLLGSTIEVTNDTWMANYAGILQKKLTGHLNKGRTDPGKGTAYLAMNIMARRAAEIITERTGNRWTPSEVQETVWSWARSLYYAAQQKKVDGKSLPLVDFLKNGGLTAQDIANTPDFEVLFVTGVYEDILREAGYGDQIERIRQLAEADNEGAGSDGEGRSPAWSPDSGVDRETYERHLQEAAGRLSSEQVQANLDEEQRLRELYQDESSPRGKLEVTDSGERLVSLFQNADESTFMHETGHIFLLDFEELASRDDAPEQVKKDWETLKKWLGVEHGQKLDITHHEQFARGFEAWLMEGEAPSPRLARVFEWFRKWLTNVYHSVAQLDVVLSDEVRGVYDRMFALEDEIENRTFYQDEIKPVDELPPDPEASEETQAIMAMEGPANRAADGDEEALFDPVWFKEGSPEAATEVDDFLEAAEAIAMKTEAWKGWQNLVKTIRNMGGISYDQVTNLLGKDMADRIRETAGWLYRRAGLAMDEMAQRLAENGFDVTDAQNLFNQLTNRPENPNQLPPVLEVTQDNLPWLLERLGTAQTRRYLKRRIEALDATLKELRAEHEKASNEGKDEAMAQMLKEEMWRLYAERSLAAETEEQLRKAPREIPKGEPVRWSDMARRAKGQAFKWVQARVKDTIMAVTGQTAVGELVSEKEALREAMRLAQRYSRIAAQIARRTGYRAGYIEARQRVQEVKRRQEARAAERAEVRSMVKDLDSATRGGISWGYRERIADILEKYDTKRRGISKPVRELAKGEGIDPRKYQARIDAELRQFLADNPEAAEDITPDDLARLTRRSVYEMTLDELRSLHTEVMALREAGKAELKEKQQAYREKIEGTVKTLVHSLGGPKGPTEQKMVPGQRKRGFREHLNAWSLTPSRILDWLDKYGNFKGLWHTYMMRRADSAEDAFLKAKFSRHDAMMAKMKELGISESDLAAVRYSTVDPETGEKVDFTLDSILEVYVGWMNEMKRDALKYGNGIDEAMKAEMEKLLKPQEIELAQAVLADYETRRQALKDAMVGTYDVGFLDEPFYSPMYRDSWQEAGELVDTGMEAVKNEFMRVNGLRRFYAKHGFSHARKTISPEHQTPLQIGLFGNWLKTVDIQEHFIAYSSMVKEFQDVLKDPVLKQTLSARYGKEVYDTLEHFVNRLAVPDFYKGFAATDVMAKFIRSNAAVAYLAYNLGTIMKQPTALAYYLRDAGPLNLLLSAAEFAMAPRETLRKVWNLDPQVKDQAIERTLEELRRTKDPKYKRLKHAIGRAGFKPILWFDMVTRVIGWNAVYKAELAKGTDPEDARYRAQRVTLNTQQAANPKELPRYMAQNEFLNLMTIFQNQANKVWNIASHDMWGDIKTGRIGGALGSAMGLLTATFLLSLMAKGRPPEEPGELAGYLTEDIVGSVPLIGKGVISAWHGFGGGSAIDSAAQDIGKGLKGLADFEFGGDEILALYEAYSILWGGVPVTAVKRLLKTLDEGRPGALLGWRKEKRKKDVMAYF